MRLDDALRDLLREHGADEDMLAWLEQPQAVRALLKAADPRNGDGYCWACSAAPVEKHDKACAVVWAWKLVGGDSLEPDV